MSITIYHNPNCGTSRNVLALIRDQGIEPTIVEYLKNPPSRDTLVAMVGRSGGSVRDFLRERGTPFAELGLDNMALGDDALFDALVDHPILLNRPVVDNGTVARVCRPADLVLDLL